MVFDVVAGECVIDFRVLTVEYKCLNKFYMVRKTSQRKYCAENI